MAFKFVVLFVCIFGSTVSGETVGDDDVETPILHYSEHVISGESGTFRYPLSGATYENNERVTITADFPPNTLFIIEDYDIESDLSCAYDKLSLHQWRGNTSDVNFCGRSNESKYYQVYRSFLLTFATNAGYAYSGFNLRWGQFERFN